MSSTIINQLAPSSIITYNNTRSITHINNNTLLLLLPFFFCCCSRYYCCSLSRSLALSRSPQPPTPPTARYLLAGLRLDNLPPLSIHLSLYFSIYLSAAAAAVVESNVCVCVCECVYSLQPKIYRESSACACVYVIERGILSLFLRHVSEAALCVCVCVCDKRVESTVIGEREGKLQPEGRRGETELGMLA